MKNTIRFILTTFCIAGLASCIGSKSTQSESNSIEENAVPEQTNPDPAHNARLSLDYYGTYHGVLPCGDCEGIEITIQLMEDSRFTKITQYLGKSKSEKFRAEGKFEWDKSGFVVQFIGLDFPNKYFVGENILFQLDREGKRITGDMASEYILRKIND